MNDVISALNWRFATKTFDTTKKVSEEDMNVLLEAIRLSASSLGLQPYHVVVVTNAELREKLKSAAYGQPQVTDASHLLVFCARTDVAARGEQMLQLISGGKPEELAKLGALKGMIEGSIAGKSEADLTSWASRQAYIALGNALTTLAMMKIDSCPMEGFDPAAFDALLELPENIKSVALLPVGYRAAEPAHPKMRFPATDLFSTKE